MLGGILSSTRWTPRVLPARYRMIHRHDAEPEAKPMAHAATCAITFLPQGSGTMIVGARR